MNHRAGYLARSIARSFGNFRPFVTEASVTAKEGRTFPLLRPLPSDENFLSPGGEELCQQPVDPARSKDEKDEGRRCDRGINGELERKKWREILSLSLDNNNNNSSEQKSSIFFAGGNNNLKLMKDEKRRECETLKMTFLQIFENICLVWKVFLSSKEGIKSLSSGVREIIFALIQLHKCLINKYWEIVIGLSS